MSKKYLFNAKELRELSERSKTEHFSLWYDANSNKFYDDTEAPETAHWIFDIEQEESPDFIAEVTKSVMEGSDE